MASGQNQAGSATPTYEELQAQHRGHEKRLQELSNKAWLTPDEELEEKQLKKLKLSLKDQMTHLRRAAS
ncbi:MAG: DUF465 domain-containing protein [bacterium]|nr:DUF465 domain-containing protein [bacterium]